MRTKLALFGPVSLAFLAVSPPVAAQSQADRQMYEPLYDLSMDKLQRELESFAGLQAQLEQETDLVRGCATLNESLEHLRRADELLTEIEDYTQKLHLRRDREAAQNQHETVIEDISLKEGDIERMCSSLPPS